MKRIWKVGELFQPKSLWTASFTDSPGEWGVHSSPADVLPGAGLLWPLHDDPEQHWERHAAAHWDNLSVYCIKDGGEWTWAQCKWHFSVSLHRFTTFPGLIWNLFLWGGGFRWDLLISGYFTGFSSVVGSLPSKGLTDGPCYCRHLLRRGDPSNGINYFKGNHYKLL